MQKLYKKDEVLFAVFWIVLYVVCFGNADSLSEAIGMPKAVTALVGLVLSVVLLGFVWRNGLCTYYGLCRFRGSLRGVLFFIPLVVLTSVNLWNGVTLNTSFSTALFYVLSMCWVGFLEELIFRGLLFKGMCRTNARSAIVVSSVAFGMGHIVNLLLGEPLFDTLLQLVYASAIGFCYTALFYVGGSLLPCILSHAVFNSLSVFAVERNGGQQLLLAGVHTVLALGYGVWLLHSNEPLQPSAGQSEG